MSSKCYKCSSAKLLLCIIASQFRVLHIIEAMRTKTDLLQRTEAWPAVLYYAWAIDVAKTFSAEVPSPADMVKEIEQERLLKQLQDDQLVMQDYLTRNYSPDRDQSPAAVHRGSYGIVICAGGNKLLINTYVSVKVIYNSGLAALAKYATLPTLQTLFDI